MELNWKEDHNLIRKLAKILLGDTLPNGEPVSSFISGNCFNEFTKFRFLSQPTTAEKRKGTTRLNRIIP